MNAGKTIVRRGLTGSGVATLLLAASFVVLGSPTTPSTLLLISWLVVVGSAMVAAGHRERVSIGSTTLGWPRVAAIAIALLAIGWAAVSVAGLLANETVTGLGPLEAVLTVGVVGYFAWFARECWVGGASLDEETFTVD
ncbi:hypothetical protein HYG81_07890 [Natrinema zhouii]|uniref:Uncharacterized protein n=1 Tax=Natrinema zhouii TaxID=1710539 RepID=A0A7D6CT57_9EURY|nr:hypothetical protein [Natrinema zhouii]QLK27510.1 hypothetical protein HYG81_07890 [Natrinema zhouii]